MSSNNQKSIRNFMVPTTTSWTRVPPPSASSKPTTTTTTSSNGDDDELTPEQLAIIERNRREAEERRRNSQSKKSFGTFTSNAFNSFKRKRDDGTGEGSDGTNNEGSKTPPFQPQAKRVCMEPESSSFRSPSTPVLRTRSINTPDASSASDPQPSPARTVVARQQQKQQEEPAPQKKIRPKSKMTAKQKRESEERYVWLTEDGIKDKNGRKKDDPEFDHTTIYVPSAALSEMSPFERQYWELKKEYWDTVIFFKKGKFYELYEKDAYLGKDLFDLKMTERVNMPMVGVPEGSFKHWAAKFIAAGQKVGRVEQMETPEEMKKRNKGKKQAKNSTGRVVGRELVEIITPGTLRDNEMIMDYNSPYLMSIRENQMEFRFGVAFSDVSTGKVFLTYIEQDDASYTGLETLLQQVQPRELLFEKGGLSKQTLHIIKQKLSMNPKMTPISQNKYFDSATTQQHIENGNYFEDGKWPDALAHYQDNELVMCAFGGLLYHLEEVKLASDVLSMRNFRHYEPNEHASTMIIDGQTLANLEILSNNRDHTRKGSLIEHLDRCLTSFGKRLFRKWVCAPLRRIEDINGRLDALEDLHNVSEARDDVRGLLKHVPDLERMLAKIHSESRIEKDAVYFDSKLDEKKINMFLDTLSGLKKINEIATKLSELAEQFETETMKTFAQIVPVEDVDCVPMYGFPQIEGLLDHFDNAFDHKVARDHHMICPNKGEDEEYDEVTNDLKDLENEFEEHLKTVRKTLKCASASYKHLLKDSYQIEVPNNVKVPKEFTVVTKTSKMNRYYTPWIRENLTKLQDLENKKEEVLRRQMKKMFKKFDAYYNIWARAIDYCAELDCLFSLSLTSFESHLLMVRPKFVHSDRPLFDIKQMIHPCVASPNASTAVQPNDTLLGGLTHPSCSIVTGPNMGGKSTLLRQNCIAIIMAQLGCYVPAQEFTLSPVDRIFTRIGANDKIMAGESTFMVELNETSNIINNATRDSFVILDEMGRGTSTFDGLSIAYSVVQYLAEKIRCRTLFSTHYYNLTEQLKFHPLIAMYQMECHVNPEDKNDITFLYKYSPGVCPKSYGMNVARMAGVDPKIVDRASQIAETFEQNLEKQVSGTTLDSSHISADQTQRFLKLNMVASSQVDAQALRAQLRMLQSATMEYFTSFH